MNIPKNGPVIRLTSRVAILAVTLLLAFCIAAQAAVVEGGDVEREVDTPAGIQIQKHLGEESSEPEILPTSTGPTTHAPPQPTPTSFQQEPETPTETGAQVPSPETPAAKGGILGYVVVGLLVVALGTFIVLMVARSRGKN
ncbi:MAG: hypothetical protein GX934_00495 [Burkholderiales bacterium]|jgi:hypothetical protein|nr:hypothetical protein [Burkholderiales bacterium]